MSAAPFERRGLDVEIVGRAAPDQTGGGARGGVGDGVFVRNDAQVAWRFLRERIFFGHGEDCGCAAQHRFADREERGVMRGMAEDGEPELPVEGRLVGWDPRGRAGVVVGFVRKLVREPRAGVVAALEDTFPARVGHNGEEPRAVG